METAQAKLRRLRREVAAKTIEVHRAKNLRSEDPSHASPADDLVKKEEGDLRALLKKVGV